MRESHYFNFSWIVWVRKARKNLEAFKGKAWRRQWHPTPVLLPGKSHGWRSLVGCSPWDCEESDTTEQLHVHFSLSYTGACCHFLLQCMKVKSENQVAQSCPTLHDLMDCGLPGSSTHGIFQARVLEWGAIAFSVFHVRETKEKKNCICNNQIKPNKNLPKT